MLWAMDERTLRAPRGSRAVLLAWLPAVAWAALIFVSSAQSSISFAPDPWLDFLIRKSGHMGVFGILALLLWRAVARSTSWRRPWAWALGLAVAYAISDEVHQGFVGRDATLRDVAFDAAGAIIAVVAMGIIRRSRRS
jgi:VanZ family protein